MTFCFVELSEARKYGGNDRSEYEDNEVRGEVFQSEDSPPMPRRNSHARPTVPEGIFEMLSVDPRCYQVRESAREEESNERIPLDRESQGGGLPRFDFMNS